MKSTSSLLAGAALAACAVLASSPLMAQSFPGKPVRIVAPYVAGGTVDVLSRALAVQLTEEFGQQVVVENRAGASGNIGAEYVAGSDPDGHVLLLTC